MEHNHRVIIIGGGFAGVRTALDLSRTASIEVVLITNNPYFEYYPGLHKLVGISDHPVYQVPLVDIFKNTSVRIIYEPVLAIDAHTKTVTTTHQQIQGESLVIALGSQTEYFNISGLKDTAFSFKSVAEAKRLREHVELMFQKHVTTDKAETVVGLHMIVVGGGPNGVDLVGELAVLTQHLAKKYGIVESLVTLDLIEASSRVLAMLPESVSLRVEKRLQKLGVNVLCNRDLRQQNSWTTTLADMTLGAKTLIWTAGVVAHEMLTRIDGFQMGKKNRVIVDEYLQAQGFQNVFIIGDSADTPYSGLAQTALYDAGYVARVITRKVRGKKYASYVPKPNAFNIGVGRRWSVMMVGSWVMYGFVPYVMRTIIDTMFFLLILSPVQVFRLYFPKRSE